MGMIRTCLLLLLLPAAALSADRTPSLRSLEAERTEKGVVVRFSVNCFTDVALFVENEKGTCIRHLGGGALGPHAPPPFQKNSLSQELLWDLKDDWGRAAGEGPFRIRLGLGLRAVFDRLIGFNPAALESVRGLALAPSGELFVLHVTGELHPSDGTCLLSVFDRRGRYRRMIIPYPADLPEEKLVGLKRVALTDGRHIPFVYEGETRSLLPGAGDLPPHDPVATSDGRIAFVGVQQRAAGTLRYAQAGVAQLTVIRADGSVPQEGFRGTILASLSSSAANLALSPDEKTLYASGLYRGAYSGKPTHAVYRFAWSDRSPSLFAGVENEPGSDRHHFRDPSGIAVDLSGNVYVADKGNNRIVVLRPDGRFLTSFHVERPERIRVHPRTGAVYVLCGQLLNELRKFGSLKDPHEIAFCKLPFFKHKRYTALLALDATDDLPVLWTGTPFARYARMRLLRIEDHGRSFSHPHDVVEDTLAKNFSVGPVMEVSADRETETVYAAQRGRRGFFFHGPTGKLRKNGPPQRGGSGNTGTIGQDGCFYLFHNYPSASVSRFTLRGKPLPFGRRPSLDGLGSPRVRGRGLAADRNSTVYVLYQKSGEKLSRGDAPDANACAVFSPEGACSEEKIIDAEIRSLNSVRLDPAGNIYVAVGARPQKRGLPNFFRDLNPGMTWRYGAHSTEIDWYTLMYGSIIKFGPSGGTIRSGIGGQPLWYGYNNRTEVRGAQWVFFGVSNVPSWRTEGTPDVCLCESPRFDVDLFGRSFVPDALCFCVRVIDTAGNEITTIGSYGNQDSAGPRSAVPEPPIAFLWPQAAAVTDKALYVADRLNRRILRAKLTYARCASCPVRETP